MKIIDYDPSKKIPPISENLEDKIIISYSIDNGRNSFINYVVKDSTDIYRFRGCMQLHDTDIWIGSVTTWSDNYNVGNTILELLISEYNCKKLRNWPLAQCIIESYDELIRIMCVFSITGDLKTELMACWEKLPVNQKA